MELLKKIETMVEGWLKPLPNWPRFMQSKLAGSLWWIVIILAIASMVGAIGDLFRLIGGLEDLGRASVSNEAVIAKGAISSGISLAANAAIAILLYFAYYFLRERQKPGWYLSLAALVVHAISVVLLAVLTFTAIGFIAKLLFGGIGVALLAYMLFQTRSHFMHTERSKGLK